MFKIISDTLLFIACLCILGGSLYLTFKTRFVQLKCFPALFKMIGSAFSKKQNVGGDFTIAPHRALFTAMSTTLGLSTIVGPVIAMNIGGPGALLGFLLTSFFGMAATYFEVKLSVEYREKLKSGVIMGGPMQYLKRIFSPKIAKWYAVSCMLLMIVWCGAQANQLSAILDSPLLEGMRVPTYVSGIVVALLVFVTLMGGIKRIGALSAKLVPIMFALYLGASLWIIFSNLSQLMTGLALVWSSAFSPYAMANGALVGGIVSALRWGIFKGTQSCEAGIGTQAIPHSLAETKDPVAQGTLAMISTLTAGVVAFISGCVTLVTNTWQDPSLPLGISMVAASYEQYFSYFGVLIVAISTLLFGFGTILGNSFNGSQCFGYLTQNKKIYLYFLATVGMIFFGSVAEVKTFWSMIDIVLAGMAVPHIAALVVYAYRQPKTVAIEPSI
jgi:AGCS family alanine or glycine:cation symporter